MATPVEICAQRDPKGLYARARRGELQGLTGAGGEYEPPLAPDLRVGPADTPAAVAGRVVALLTLAATTAR
ncbi:adenylyl-sulfate kinase [Svornostia abyssi]|uniref:adenylyl-sulfate kinase n=1 Tax=Svornostia abyssi TaxID=2898438 RepID=UPI00338F43DD